MQAQSRTDFDLAEFYPLIKEVLDSGGEFRLYPRGTSMMPLLRQGTDSVILVKCDNKPRKRDIIFYRRPNGQFVLHRIVGTSKDGTYVLCGDNQTALEKGITDDMIIAVVTDVFRGDKRLAENRFSRKLYELLWCAMPIRKILFFVRRCLSKIKRTIFK